jgi:hypothetical protein
VNKLSGVIALVLATVLLLFSLLTVIPAPLYPLWKLRILVTELRSLHCATAPAHTARLAADRDVARCIHHFARRGGTSARSAHERRSRASTSAGAAARCDPVRRVPLWSRRKTRCAARTHIDGA